MRKKKIRHKLLDVYLVSLSELFSKESKIRIVLVLYENHDLGIDIPIIRMSGLLDQSYAHIYRMLHELETEGFVEIIRKGRSNIVTLTKKGLVLGSLMSDMVLDTVVSR